MKKLSFLWLFLIIAFLFPVAGHAMKVDVTPSGSGVFIVQGVDLVNVGGIKIVISYDQALLKSPRVEKGSLINNAPGNMFMPNPTGIPGQVIIAAIHPSGGFNGSGPIAILSFGQVSSGQGRQITNVLVDLVQQRGDQQQTVDRADIQTSITNPDGTTTTDAPVVVGGGTPPGGSSSGAPVSGSSSSGSPSTQGSGSAGTGTGTTGGTGNTGSSGTGQGSATAYLGTVTMPSDTPSGSGSTETSRREQAAEAQPYQQEARSFPRETEHSPSPQESSKPAGEKKFVAHKGLPDQFKELKGETTPAGVLALFEKFSVPGMIQDPPVALSDGKAKIKLVLDLPAGKESPNFALKGAKLVSLKNDDKGKWVLEALPAKGSNDVRLTVLQDNLMTEIPLVVAQPVAPTTFAGGKLDMPAFEHFLKERGTEKAPKFDLTGDGVRNYLDDYVFTANFVARNGIPRKGAEPAKKPEAAGKEAPKVPGKEAPKAPPAKKQGK